MKPYPVRLPESLIDDLEAEAEDRDLGTAEYVRKILRQRDSTQENTQPSTQEYTQEHTQEYTEHAERVDELEDRVEALEEKLPDEVWGQDGQKTLAELFEDVYDLAESPSNALEEPGPGDATPRGRTGTTTLQNDESRSEVIEDAVDAVAASWEDNEQRLAQRRAAAIAVLRYAVENDVHVGKTEAIDQFHGDHSVTGQSEETWWRKNVRPVLSEYGTYSQGQHGYRVGSEDLHDGQGVYDPVKDLE